MSPETIKKELADYGYNLSMIAEAMNRSPSLVSKVVAGTARSYVVAQGVAKALNKSVDEVFPNTYKLTSSRDYSKTEAYKKKTAELRSLLQGE